MISTKLYPIDGPWRGKLALASRPRGGEWLAGEVSEWHRSGIDAVASLLTPEEEKELNLEDEPREVRSQHMSFISFPIPDRCVPLSQTAAVKFIETLNSTLTSGRNLVLHCRQGIGRSGLIAACLLIAKGWTPHAAIVQVSKARGSEIPETREQREWINQFAATLANSR